MSDAQVTQQTTEAPPEGTQSADNSQPPAAPVEKDWKAEYEKTLAESRKWEDRAKKALPAVKELDELKKQGMTDVEKATTEAKAAGMAEARQQFGARLVDAEVRAAAAGRDINLDALLKGLDRSQFLTDDGEPDTKAITAFVEAIAPKAANQPLDLGQGARPGTETAPDMNTVIRNRIRQ